MTRLQGVKMVSKQIQGLLDKYKGLKGMEGIRMGLTQAKAIALVHEAQTVPPTNSNNTTRKINTMNEKVHSFVHNGSIPRDYVELGHFDDTDLRKALREAATLYGPANITLRQLEDAISMFSNNVTGASRSNQEKGVN